MIARKFLATETFVAQNKPRTNLEERNPSNNSQSLVAGPTVVDKANKRSTTHKSRQSTACRKDNYQLTRIWHSQIILPYKCEEYLRYFLEVSIKIKLTRKWRFFKNTATKRNIELVDPRTQPVLLAPYRVGPRSVSLRKCRPLRCLEPLLSRAHKQNKHLRLFSTRRKPASYSSVWNNLSKMSSLHVSCTSFHKKTNA